MNNGPTKLIAPVSSSVQCLLETCQEMPPIVVDVPMRGFRCLPSSIGISEAKQCHRKSGLLASIGLANCGI